MMSKLPYTHAPSGCCIALWDESPQVVGLVPPRWGVNGVGAAPGRPWTAGRWLRRVDGRGERRRERGRGCQVSVESEPQPQPQEVNGAGKVAALVGMCVWACVCGGGLTGRHW